MNFGKKAKVIFTKGNLLDKIDYLRYVIDIILCIIVLVAYNKKYMLSIRGAISDTISFSSITLGVLGVLIGLLMSLKEESIFFKKAQKYDLDNDIYTSLINRMRNAFIFNLFLLILSVFYCFVIPNMPFFIKCMGLIIWFFLFIFVSWDTVYLIWIIVKICTFKNNDDSVRESRS
ncbi:hypothetical protein MM669_001633 [Enterococcus faecium]|nr:hypothetical protein [Enterococcus faecium]EME8154666.1 hypothetical protein [Enterococcus faecium]